MDNYPPVDTIKLKYLNLLSIHESVVLLNFRKEGKEASGTGFFIIVPDSPYEVILTAGHNLYSHDKKFTTNVRLVLPNSNPFNPAPLYIPILPENIKVSPEYMDDPTNTEADYGAILLPWTGKQPGNPDIEGRRRGFGFKATHALSELRGEVTVSTYRDLCLPGQPVISMGPVLIDLCTEKQLVYDAKTEQGNSGSPVWIAYGDNDIAVVAIHNNSPDPKAKGPKGSRGSRLSPKVMREVFAWADLNAKKKIKAEAVSKNNPVPLPPNGLFMVFGSMPFARLQRGTGSEFNVLPMHVVDALSGKLSRNRFALAFGNKWVAFKFDTQEAVLVDMLQEQSLFSVIPMPVLKPPKVQKFPGAVQIVLENNYKLRMDGSALQSFDRPDAQTSGLSIVKLSNQPFQHFTFYPHIPFTPLETAIDYYSAPSAESRCPHCQHCNGGADSAP